MPQNPMTIVPVTLHTEPDGILPIAYVHSSGLCTIKLAKRGGAHHPNDHEGADPPMRQDYTSVKNIYIICGKTDMRK
ncbi:hypothetical protein [Lederbergia citri]|uniref:Uncharacterized protein n=1 Tax=Lederbergia citri TaxID=2833580 RepID=A0A942YHY1_9BACI|nr:hypothetical protein [Lederbergia citri]MBS4195875.1 hypothetical protein [Lederbergia citri]